LKLRDDFIFEEIDGRPVLVCISDKWNGIIKCSRSMSIVVTMLREGTDREALLKALEGKYEVPTEILSADLERILNDLQCVGAIES